MNEQLTGLKFKGQILLEQTYEWYEFRQNNSGGSFHITENLSHFVLIQATNPRRANELAEDVGIYFDGCSSGKDCNCCGDRWCKADSAMESFYTYEWRMGIGIPTDYPNVLEYAQAVADGDDCSEDSKPSVILYFADGVVKRFYNTKKGK